MNVKTILKEVMFEDSNLSFLKDENPKQFFSSELRIPVWRVEYSYKTVRNNEKKGMKFTFHREDFWDSVENDFYNEVELFNSKHKGRELLNVKILNSEYLGEMIVNIDN